MRIIALSILLLISSVSNQPVIAAEPSFDCAKASQRVEHVICQSDKLARQDLKLSRLYQKVMEKLPGDVKKEMKTEQLGWLKDRNRACNLADKESEKCLLQHYRKRNKELSALLAFDSSDRPGNDDLRILRIIPKGDDVPAGRQIVIQFDRAVVPIGRMERNSKDIPVSITPKLNCEWRWLNTSALACQLREEDKMQQATRYNIEMLPGIETEDGVSLKRKVAHIFTTTRPKVTYTRFVNWLSPGTPLIQVTLNQAVTRSSLEKSMSVKAGRKSIGVIAYPDDIPRRLPWWLAIANDRQRPGVDDQLVVLDDDEARRVWVIEPRSELALDKTVSLYVKPGLKSSGGRNRV